MAHHSTDQSGADSIELPDGTEIWPITEEIATRLSVPDEPDADKDSYNRFLAVGILATVEHTGGTVLPITDVLYASPRGRFVVNSTILGNPDEIPTLYQANTDNPWDMICRYIFVPSAAEMESSDELESGPSPTPDHLIEFVCESLEAYTDLYDAYDGPWSPSEIRAEQQRTQDETSAQATTAN